MAEEIINLEYAPKIGVVYSIVEGLKGIVKGIKPFIKIFLLISALAVVSLTAMLAPIHISEVAPDEAVAVPFMLGVFAIGIVVFFYGCWKYLLSFVAISYLAKDIYENKPVQKISDYFRYVEQHSKSYVKYWLWIALFTVVSMAVFIVLSVLFLSKNFLTTITSGMLSHIPAIHYIPLFVLALAFILAIPFFIAIQFSTIFWAYQDKTYPLNAILDAIKVCYRNCFKIVGYGILLTFICYIINRIYMGIAYLLNYGMVEQAVIDSNNAIVVNGIGKYLIIYTSTEVVISILIAFVTSFVFTRYYFELKNEQ